MDFEKENLLCSGCNKPISKHVKFCSQCGTRNESYEDYTEPVTNYDDTFDDVVAEENNYLKPASRKGIKYAVILGVVALIVFLSVNVFAKTLFPDKYVKSAMLNTYNAISKNNKEYRDMPGIISYLSQTNDVTENEIYLKFEDLGSDFDRYISNLLEDYALKINLQNDLKNGSFNFNLGLFDGSIELLSAQMYGSSDYMSLGIPALYNGHLGVTASSEITDSYSDYEYVKNNATIIAKYYKAVNDSKPVIKAKSEDLAKELIGLAKFKKGVIDNTYLANISGDAVLDLIENHILDLIKDENIKNAIFYTAYLEAMNYITYEEARVRFDEALNEVPTELKYIMNEIKLDDIEVSVSLGDKKLVKDFQVQTRLTNEYDEAIKLRANGNIDSTNGFKTDFNIRINTDYDYFNIGLSVNNSKEDKNLLNKTIYLSMSSSIEEAIFIEINEEYDSSSKDCKSKARIGLDSNQEGISLETRGKFDGKDKIEFNSIDLALDDYYYSYTLNLSGYIQNKNIKSINKVDKRNVKFINEMSEIELENLMEEIEANMYFLSNELF